MGDREAEVKLKFSSMPPGLDFSQALAEADRCLLCHDAPCSKACPADTRPGEFIRKFRFKNLTGAARTIKSANILGGACGVLCPTEQLCEKECSARMSSEAKGQGTERPVRIGALQRFIVEYARTAGFSPLKVRPQDAPARIAVVGSGPAGLSCAAELARAGHKVTVFEARPETGGVLRYGVVSFRFDQAFLDKELADLQKLGVEFQCNSPIAGPSAAENLLGQGYQAVFVGPGLWGAHSLAENSAQISGCFSSIEYLAALREGRYGELLPSFMDKTVAVIGGGSVAMDCVESAVRLGARDVYLIYRRSFSQMPAAMDEKMEALKSGVHYMLLHQPIEYLTDSENHLTGLKLARTRLGEPDDSGRRSPCLIEGSHWDLEADVVIEAIGNRAAQDSPSWYPGLKLHENQLIVADPQTGATSLPGIFAGGDIVRGPGLVVEAVRDGKKAARAILDYLRENKAE